MSLWSRSKDGNAGELLRFVRWKWVLLRRGKTLRILSIFAFLILVFGAIISTESMGSRRDYLEAMCVPVEEILPQLRGEIAPLHMSLIGAAAALLAAMLLQKLFFSRLFLFHVLGELPLAALLCLAWPYALRNGMMALCTNLAPLIPRYQYALTAPTFHDLLMIALLFALRRRFAWNSWVEPARIEWATKALEVLAADMVGTAHLDLDVHHLRLSRKKPEGRFSEKYVDPWFALKTPLADGNRLFFRLTLRMSRKVKSKRKYTKIVERWNTSIDLGLRRSSRRFPSPRPVEGLVGTNVTDALSIGAASWKDSVLRIHATTSQSARHQNRYAHPADIGDTPDPTELEGVLRLLACAHAQLGPIRLPEKVARRLSKKQKAPSGQGGGKEKVAPVEGAQSPEPKRD